MVNCANVCWAASNHSFTENTFAISSRKSTSSKLDRQGASRKHITLQGINKLIVGCSLACVWPHINLTLRRLGIDKVQPIFLAPEIRGV